MQFAALAALVFAGCSGKEAASAAPAIEPHSPSGVLPATAGLPAAWNRDEIAAATPPYGVSGKVLVLAWKTIARPGGLRVDSCLAVRILDHDDGLGGWAIAHLYRHPEDKPPRWQIASTHVSGGRGNPGLWILHSRRFREPPTNRELYASFDKIDELSWSFDADVGFQLETCGIDDAKWRSLTGERPTRTCAR